MSVTALLVLAAEAAEGVEPSKVPFYVGGGLLAVWAVVLSLLGLSRPGFPATDGAARGVYGVSAVLVVAAMATTILSS